jgi:hypothetical protein
MKPLYIIFTTFFLTSVTVFAEDLIITSNGKRIVNESINIGDNITRTLIKNESTFVDNKGNYGITTCLGTLENTLDNVEYNLKCESINQKDERYWTKVYRGQGEQDAGVGTIEFIGGEGFYKNLIGKRCNYAIRYFRADIFFFKQVCKL